MNRTNPRIQVSELLDPTALQRVLDTLYAAAQVPSAVADLSGAILCSAGWQVCPECEQEREDKKVAAAAQVEVAEGLHTGEPFRIFACPHGLADSCVPVIVSGTHVANIFSGNMLRAPLTSEAADQFRRLARSRGVDESAYLEALAKLPVVSLDKNQKLLALLGLIAQQISQLLSGRIVARQQHAQIQESEQRFRLVLDSLEAIVYVADMDTYEILFINEYGRNHLGAVEGTVCWQSIQSGQTGPCDFCTNKLIVQPDGTPGAPYTWEFQNTLIKRWYQIIDRAIRWTDGRIVRLEIATDITERKHAEASRAVLETRLLQAQKMEAIGTMAGGIAHDFNNILAIIMGATALATLDLSEEHPVRESLDAIMEASRRAKGIVKHILSFSRKEVDEQKPTYLCRLVKDNMKVLRGTIPTSVQVTVCIPELCETQIEKCNRVLADPYQIHQVLMNLCGNAVQAMNERGHLRVTVEEVRVAGGDAERPALKPGVYECFSVTDNGTGIAARDLPKVFDPFFTTKEVGKGTGMGLAVVHGIVERHGGKIEVKTEVGKGTTFRIYLPAIGGGAVETDIALKGLPGGSEHILFVDDEPHLVSVWAKTLALLHYQVTTASNAGEALELFRTNPTAFDVVITDQTMPKMTGSEMATQMLAMRPDLPIILCTGFSNLIDEAQAKRLGIRHLLYKPVDHRHLAVFLREMLHPASLLD